MEFLKGKKIILGITGSIAAYKSAFLTRLFIKAGAEVQVIMTPSATNFISGLTLSTLSKRPVHSDIATDESWNNHVELGLWADLLIIAPATATTMAKMAQGICDNMLLATYLSAKCPVYFAPAMDLDMWKHPSTQNNLATLKSYGNKLIPVGHGELASGLVGDGRMAEPEAILAMVKAELDKSQDLAGKKVLITAGPTYEAIDPVRFIGNRSSGKMGVAIAENAAERGAEVYLVLGPSKLTPQHKNINTIRVESAQEMYDQAHKYFKKCTVAILAAAVADYRPQSVATKKIKKKTSTLSLKLEKTQDIAASLGQIKRKNQKIVGFALETNNEIANAQGKLERKSFDFIVLNSLNDKGAGFSHDTNKITIIAKGNKIKKFELKSKTEVAVDIVNELVDILPKKKK